MQQSAEVEQRTQLLAVKGFCATVRIAESSHIKDDGINERAPFWRGRK